MVSHGFLNLVYSVDICTVSAFAKPPKPFQNSFIYALQVGYQLFTTSIFLLYFPSWAYSPSFSSLYTYYLLKNRTFHFFFEEFSGVWWHKFFPELTLSDIAVSLQIPVSCVVAICTLRGNGDICLNFNGSSFANYISVILSRVSGYFGCQRIFVLSGDSSICKIAKYQNRIRTMPQFYEEYLNRGLANS